MNDGPMLLHVQKTSDAAQAEEPRIDRAAGSEMASRRKMTASM